MLILIDNYDSFTYNLVQYLGELGEEVRVFRNDKITVDAVEALKPDRIVISPGPCTPREAGISVELIQRMALRQAPSKQQAGRQGERRVPILGVCLGHQAMAAAFGGKIVGAKRIMHGKISLIRHNSGPLYAHIPNPFEATRYHSLAVERESLPKDFVITAWTDDQEDKGEIMGIRHATLPLEGVQFHPESIMTKVGKTLLKNFLNTPS